MGTEGGLMVPLGPFWPMQNNDSIMIQLCKNAIGMVIILALKLVFPSTKQVITQMVLDKVKTTIYLPTGMWIIPCSS